MTPDSLPMRLAHSIEAATRAGAEVVRLPTAVRPAIGRVQSRCTASRDEVVRAAAELGLVEIAGAWQLP